MEIQFRDKKLRAALEDEATCKRTYGSDMTKKIMLRLAVLKAAESLWDFWPPKRGPERCHELIGELAGTFSIDLKQPYRLLFVPVHAEPPAEYADEQQRWKAIKVIEITGIEDTHG